MSYRPEGWDEIIAAIRSELINEPFFLHAPSVNVIETVGNKYADAMLGALRGKALTFKDLQSAGSLAKEFSYLEEQTSINYRGIKGKISFIPDDKEG